MRVPLLLAALIFASPAAAQAPASAAAQGPRNAEPDRPPAEAGSDIVVVGSAADRRERIRDFVEALSDEPGADPLARFDRTDLCPAAVGLGEAQNAAIAARMRLVARAVSLPLADPGCRPNVLVIIAPDKEEMIAALRRRHPIYFRNAVNQEVEVPRERGPATAWHLDARVDRSGLPVGFDEERGHHVLSTPVAPSRISGSVRPVIVAAAVVIEAGSLAGLTTIQVADYAAMRAFARADPARLARANVPTILNVLEAPMGSVVPASLTQWDLSYLRALYAATEYHDADSQRSTIRRRMERDLSAAEPEAE